MAIKELQTRIALKYDSYANWNKWYTSADPTTEVAAPNFKAEGFDFSTYADKGAAIKLNKGEIGLCAIEAADKQATTAPTVLFKVGDGVHRFCELKWASALAADVYDWAKASDVELVESTVEGKKVRKLSFVGTNKTVTLNFITEAEVTDITGPIAAAVAEVSGNLTSNVDSITSRLDTIESTDATKAGSIAKAKADAIAEAASKAGTAEANAKIYTDREVGKHTQLITNLTGTVGTNSAAISEYAGKIAKEAEDRAKAIKDLDDAYKAADEAITAKIGTLPTGDGAYTTLVAGIADAKSAGTAAASAVSTLETTKVDVNTQNIGTNTAAISELSGNLATEKQDREDADDALSERLEKVEAFFGAAEDHDGYTGLDTALDTLKEIQDYLSGEEGAATGGLISRVATNEEEIESIWEVVGEDGTLTTAVGTNTADISEAKGNIISLGNRATALEQVTASYSGADAIKTAVEAAASKGQQGITDAKAADDKAVDAQTRVGAIETALGDGTTDGLVKKVNQATVDIAEISPKVTQAEADIDALEAIVKNGDNTNAKLRTDITELQGIVKTGNDNNAKLRSDLTILNDIVADPNTGLAATKGIADAASSKAAENASSIAAIADHYVSVNPTTTGADTLSLFAGADIIIFNCGDATSSI